MSTSVNEVYTKYIQSLGPNERVELLALIARDLPPKPPVSKGHSIAELRGLGKEVWEGIDAQDYVDRLREEWEASPR